MSTYGEIYLMIDGNCKRKNEHIYIIGKSQPEQGVYDVLNYYSKDSKILYHQYTNDTINTMKKIKLCFDKKFIKKQEYGDNWYQGDLIEILLELTPIVNKNDIKINKNFKLSPKKSNYEKYKLWNNGFSAINEMSHEEKYADLFKVCENISEELLVHFDKYSEPNPTALIEACEYNVFSEYGALDRFDTYNEFGKCKNMLYDKARYCILKYIIECVRNDPINGDYYEKSNSNLMKEAGELLNKTGDYDAMGDGLFWSFVPKRYHREIEVCWENNNFL